MALLINLPTTILGRTGLKVTRLGIGGAYCESPETYRAAIDLGVTYVDTARAYHSGEDERYIGEAIQGVRQNLVLSSKSTSRDAVGARKDLETSLRLLGTDYLDVWHLHHVNDQTTLNELLRSGGAMETAVRAKEQGLVRFIGITGHVWEIVGKAVDTGLFDNVLCWYNCAMREPEELVFPYAQKHNTGVVIMNATRQDKLLNAENALQINLPGEDEAPPLFKGHDLRQVPPLAGFYRYVLSHPAVNVTLRALRDLDMFIDAAKVISERTLITTEEKAWYEAFGQRMLAGDMLTL